MHSERLVYMTARAEVPAHPAEEAAVCSLHSGTNQAQAPGRLVQRLAHHRARIVHQDHVPDLRHRATRKCSYKPQKFHTMIHEHTISHCQELSTCLADTLLAVRPTPAHGTGKAFSRKPCFGAPRGRA